MKKKFFLVMLFLIAISPVIIFNGCVNDDSSKDEHMENSDMHMENSEMNETHGNMVDSTSIRNAGFKIVSADENKDGKVFQCPMHYNVISDENGDCPTCNMSLVEYSVDKAQMNFDKQKK